MDEESVSSDVQQLLQANNAQLLQSINTLVTQKIGSLKEELQASQEITTQAQLAEIRKVKYGALPTFKRKANEDQYKHNMKVVDTLHEAQGNLQLAKYDIVKEKLDEGMELMQKRQKLVLLADSSDYGWSTAQEYVSHDLAADSDDEKRIWKAEMRASRKIKEKIQKAKKSRPKKFPSRSETPAGTPGYSFSKRSTVQRHGVCFGCGRPGHYRSECRALAIPTTVQASTHGGTNNSI